MKSAHARKNEFEYYAKDFECLTIRQVNYFTTLLTSDIFCATEAKAFYKKQKDKV